MELVYKWITLANRHYYLYLNRALAPFGLNIIQPGDPAYNASFRLTVPLPGMMIPVDLNSDGTLNELDEIGGIPAYVTLPPVIVSAPPLTATIAALRPSVKSPSASPSLLISALLSARMPPLNC